MIAVLPRAGQLPKLILSSTPASQETFSLITWTKNGARPNLSKKRIAHGTLIFTIAIGLTADVVNEVSMTYGYERLRFLKPVFIGDTIRTSVTIKDKKDHKRPGQGLVTELVEVTNQHNEVVMVCEHILLVNKKESA